MGAAPVGSSTLGEAAGSSAIDEIATAVGGELGLAGDWILSPRTTGVDDNLQDPFDAEDESDKNQEDLDEDQPVTQSLARRKSLAGEDEPGDLDPFVELDAETDLAFQAKGRSLQGTELDKPENVFEPIRAAPCSQSCACRRPADGRTRRFVDPRQRGSQRSARFAEPEDGLIELVARDVASQMRGTKPINRPPSTPPGRTRPRTLRWKRACGATRHLSWPAAHRMRQATGRFPRRTNWRGRVGPVPARTGTPAHGRKSKLPLVGRHALVPPYRVCSPCDHHLQELAGAAGQRVHAFRLVRPRHAPGRNVLAAQRHRQAGEGDRVQQPVVVDLAEAGAAVLVLREVAVVLDAEAADLVGAGLDVGERVDVEVVHHVAGVVVDLDVRVVRPRG